MWSSVLAYQNYAQSLRPIADLMARLASPVGADDRPIVAQSLDEMGVMAVQIDALLRRHADAQRALRENQSRLTMFAEAASDYFYEMDENLRFSYFSDRFEQITGIPSAEVIGLTSSEMSAKFMVPNYSEHQFELERHKPYRDFRFATRRPDGRLLHLQVSAVPFFDEHGTFRGYRGTGANITPIVETQQTLNIREAELAQAQKMEAVGQLTGGIAHDFNNLLTVILGNLELLEVVCGDRTQLQTYIDAAIAAAKRGGALTQRLLAFSRRQSLHPDSVDLAVLFGSIAELLRRTLGEDITLTVESEASLWPCHVDRHQLENSILNLALNSRDAMPHGGELSFELSNYTVGERNLGGVAGVGDYVRIRVRDTGEGIAADVLPHVFEPFFTTKAPGEGSGLGMSMVYGFVRQSGGDVTVHSELGRGTTVSLLLPRAVGRAGGTR
ncbi:MAG: PAS domain S-box protein, partial [Gammaproteobacteria bacterium]|nr:PAS domain S-box protein [Gammaproteobacteria bacterium]